MFLSRVNLNYKKRETMEALVIPSIMHGAVERSFEGVRRRNLWRVDWMGEECFLLVVSPEKPNFTHLIEQFGYSSDTLGWDTMNYESLLNRIRSGDRWKFRLKANPVQSSMSDKDKVNGRGKIHAHVTQDQQRAWLMQRSDKYGFSLQEDSFDVVHTQWEKFPKNRNKDSKIIIRTATFEGVLMITNAETFGEMLRNGIGKAKSYGCGLLTVAPLEGEHYG